MNLFRRLALFLVVWSLSFSTSAAQPPDPPSRLHVSLFNDARIPPVVVASAESRASAIFAHAGIEVEWLDCAPSNPTDFTYHESPCSAVAWPSHLAVRIVDQGTATHSDTFGQSFLDKSGCGVHATVYYQNLTASRNHVELSDAEMLGYVIAHEVGHLLLGTNSHSPAGIMQGKWLSSAVRAAARHNLYFTSAQSGVLRSRFAAAPVGILTARRQ